jgi:hypothetical protein
MLAFEADERAESITGKAFPAAWLWKAPITAMIGK